MPTCAELEVQKNAKQAEMTVKAAEIVVAAAARIVGEAQLTALWAIEDGKNSEYMQLCMDYSDIADQMQSQSC